MEEIIDKLRSASKAYRLALRESECPKVGEEGYDASLLAYEGMEPDQIGIIMCNLIGRI